MKQTTLYGYGMCAAVLLCFAFVAHAAVPQVINYQSRLRNANGNAINTSTKVSFSLYAAATGETALWTESYSQSSGACKKITPDHNGYFSVPMGSCAAFPAAISFTEPLFLGVTVESDAEASPRIAFAPAPYAMNAVRVGNFIADTAVRTLSAAPVGLSSADTPGFDSSALVFQGSGWNGSVPQTKEFKIQTVMTNAANYRFGIFNNSPVSELVSVLNNGNVGIGSTAPVTKLDVVGDIQASGLLSAASGKIKFGGATYSFPTTAGSLGQVLTAGSPAGTLEWQTPAGGGGGVSSVGLTAPSTFIVSGSPVTSIGALGLAWTNQSANSVLSGPIFGTAGVPSFRALVSADIPNLDASKITTGTFTAAQIPSLDAEKIVSGVLGTVRGGTGIGSYIKGDIVYSDAVNSLARLPLGASNQFLGVGVSGVPAWQALPASSAAGTVTSVGVTVPPVLTIAGSPITTVGTLAFDLATQAKNAVFVGPVSGADAKPSFRALVSADIPNLDAAKLTVNVGLPGQFLGVGLGGVPAWTTIAGGGGGSVTSVGLTAPSIFSVSGSPVTSNGTLALSLTTEQAGTVFTGPVSGADAAPSFRALVATDIPNLDAVAITSGVFAAARIPALDAANLTVNVGTSGQFLGVGTGGVPAWQALPASANGTVTSVAATVPSFLTIGGSPITTAGTLAFGLATQVKNTVFIGPSAGADAAPTFRALAPADIPDLDAARITTGIFDILRIPDISAAKITAGVLSVARGGTGLSSYNANSLIYAQTDTALGGIMPAADGKILTMAGGIPSWQTAPAGLIGGGAFGQMAFWNGTASLSGSPQFIWDNVNNRLAIGTATSPATTLVVAGDTTIGGDVVPASGSAYDLGSATKHIRNAYIDDLYIYGAGGSDTSIISAKQTVFNGVTYNWPNGGLGDDFVLTTDINGNLNWKDPKTLVPESGWRAAGGIVRLGVITDSVGVGTTAPAEKLDVVGNIQASGFLSSAAGKIQFGGATYAFPTTLPTANQILTASSALGDLAWRGLDAADIPALDVSKITTGTLPVARGGTGLATYAAGDIIYASAANVLAKLPINTNGKVLTIVGGLPAWAVAASGSSQWITSGTSIYYNLGNVGVGTATPNNKLQVAGLVNFNNALFSTSLGYQAGQVNAGAYNTFVGYQAGSSNTTGIYNTATGYLALAKNTTGGANAAHGTGALARNTTGSNNTGNGENALLNNTTGNDNTANGTMALSTNTIGNNNTAIGSNALLNSTGNLNTAMGFSALKANTTGNNNTANGALALWSNTTGNNNTANGIQALFANTTGNNNTAYGFNAGYNAAPATKNITNSVFLGYNAVANLDNLTNVIVIGAGAQATKSNQAVLGNNAIKETLLRGNVLPSADNLYDLGSPTMRWHSSWVGPGTMNITDTNGAIVGGIGAGTGNNKGKLVAKYGTTEERLGGGETSVYAGGNKTISAGKLSVNGNIEILNGPAKAIGFYSSAANGGAWMNVLGLSSSGDNVSLNQPLATGGSLNIRNVNSSGRISFQIGGIERDYIDSTGFHAASDLRLKENITELKGVLSKLNAVHGVSFSFKGDRDKKQQVGVIAQDVEKAFPELVSADSATGMKGVNYGGLAAVALQGVKELDAKLTGSLAVNGGVTVAGDILPTKDNAYDLGSPEKRFKSIYLGPGTIYMMGDGGVKASISLDEGESKGKLVVKDSEGREIVLGGGTGSGGGNCGLLCSVLTAEVKDGKARVITIVPDVDLGAAANRIQTVFANTVNMNTLAFPMATPELATASVGKMLGIVGTDGVNAIVGMVNSKDARTDTLVTDMAQAKNDIAALQAQLADLQAQMAQKKATNLCASVTIAALFKEARIVGDTAKGEWTLK